MDRLKWQANVLEEMADKEGVLLSVEEMQYGFGLEKYPFHLAKLADSILELSGELKDQDEILRYDPAWLRDVNKVRRIKQALRKSK